MIAENLVIGRWGVKRLEPNVFRGARTFPCILNLFFLSVTSAEAFLSPLRHQGGFSNCLLLFACCWGGSLLFVVREPVVWQLIVWLLVVGEVAVWQLVVGEAT